MSYVKKRGMGDDPEDCYDNPYLPICAGLSAPVSAPTPAPTATPTTPAATTAPAGSNPLQWTGGADLSNLQNPYGYTSATPCSTISASDPYRVGAGNQCTDSTGKVVPIASTNTFGGLGLSTNTLLMIGAAAVGAYYLFGKKG